jgi:hypothetical protein
MLLPAAAKNLIFGSGESTGLQDTDFLYCFLFVTRAVTQWHSSHQVQRGWNLITSVYWIKFK